MSRIGKAGFSALVRRFGYSRRLALMHLNKAGVLHARYVPQPRDHAAEGVLFDRLFEALTSGEPIPF